MFQNYSDIAEHIHVSIYIIGPKQHQKHKDKPEISNTGKITLFHYLDLDIWEARMMTT